MKEKIKKYGGLIFIGIMLSVIPFALYRRYELEHNYKITVGQIIEMTGRGYKSSGDFSFIYIYEVNNKKYSNNTNLNLCTGVRLKQVKEAFLYKYFAVAYDTKALGTSNIILSQSSAERFNYKFPDSILSILPLIDCDFNWDVKSDSSK